MQTLLTQLHAPMRPALNAVASAITSAMNKERANILKVQTGRWNVKIRDGTATATQHGHR